ncbi:MAG: cytochrome c [Deltaproteobacteria bacterium]|nr:cytochrome c [Deltaproteobacteria bacterium]
MVRNILTGAVFGFMTLAISTQVFAQADVNEKRQNLMKNQSATAKALKAAVEEKNYAVVEVKAKDIMGTADGIVAAFPKGNTTGKTKAKPEIWEKSEDFGKTAKSLSKVAGELAAAAKAGNEAEVGVKFKALGDTCGSCHKQFRAEKYGE